MNGFIDEVIALRGEKASDFIKWLQAQSITSLTYCLEQYYNQTKNVRMETELILGKLEANKVGLMAKLKDHMLLSETIGNKVDGLDFTMLTPKPDEHLLSAVNRVGEMSEKQNKMILAKVAKKHGKILGKLAEREMVEVKKEVEISKKVLPSVKGKIGEDLVKVALAAFTVQDVSKEGHKGDLLVTMDDKILLVEVKNYENAVPIKEVDKLKRDIDENCVDAALIVSLQSRIANHESFELEMYKAKSGRVVPCIFLCSPSSDIFLIHVVKIAFALVRKENQLRIGLVRKVFEELRGTVAALSKTQKAIETSITSLSESNIDLQRTVYFIEGELAKLLSATKPVLTTKERPTDLVLADLKAIIQKPKLLNVAEALVISFTAKEGKMVTDSQNFYFGEGKESWLQVMKTKVYFHTRKVVAMEAYMDRKKGVISFPLTPEVMSKCGEIITV